MENGNIGDKLSFNCVTVLMHFYVWCVFHSFPDNKETAMGLVYSPFTVVSVCYMSIVLKSFDLDLVNTLFK